MNTGKSQAGISQDMAAARLQDLHEATLLLFALLASRLAIGLLAAAMLYALIFVGQP